MPPSKKRGASSPGGAERGQKSRQRSVASPAATSDDDSSVGAVAPSSADQAAGTPDAPPSVPEPERAYVPRRRSWDDLAMDLCRRRSFKRYFRMDEDDFFYLVDLISPALMSHQHYYPSGTPSENGPVVPVEIRLAVGLRSLAGGSSVDLMLGLCDSSAGPMVGQVVDAINNCEEVGKTFLPRTKAACKKYIEKPSFQTLMEQREMAMSRES